MGDLLLTAYRQGFGGGGFGIGHMVVSAIIRGLIFGFIFRLMRNLTLAEGAVLVVVVIGLLYMWSRSRDRRF
jgi:hypothetical protein